MMKRRDFITLLGSIVVGETFAGLTTANAQRTDTPYRLGLVPIGSPSNRYDQSLVEAFLQGLRQVGLIENRHITVDTIWVHDETEFPRVMSELVQRGARLLIPAGTSAAVAAKRQTATIPIVIITVGDPIRVGLVESLSHPGGNATGFTSFEFGIGAKWLELLKQVVPALTRVAVIRDPLITAGIGQWGAIQATAPSFGVELSPISISDAAELENAIASFARGSNGGLIVTGSALAVVHRDLIIKLVARYKLPAVYYERYFVAAGGLISYGPDYVDQYRQAAAYIDRILKGEKPSDLPVQTPTKYELVINLKAAKALGSLAPTK